MSWNLPIFAFNNAGRWVNINFKTFLMHHVQWNNFKCEQYHQRQVSFSVVLIFNWFLSLIAHQLDIYLIISQKHKINAPIFISIGPAFVCPCHSTVCHLTETIPTATHWNGLYLSGTLRPFIISPYFSVCQECQNCFSRRSIASYIYHIQSRASRWVSIQCSHQEMDVCQGKLLLTEIVCLWQAGFPVRRRDLFDSVCGVQHLY